jgi:Uma2 family endonuclease
MPTVAAPVPAVTPPPDDHSAQSTLADLLHQLGDVPAGRVRLYPPPGTATFEQLVEINERFKPTCEWVDGTLVEKPMGQRESFLTFLIMHKLGQYMEAHDPGMFLGPDGVLRILPGLGRAPDVSFIPWSSLPGGKPPPRTDTVPDLVPALAIEVLSKSNTSREMERKRSEYFRAGVQLVWEFDPETRSATVYTGPDRSVTVSPDGVLEGGDVLPGFQLSLKELFDRADRQPGSS